MRGRSCALSPSRLARAERHDALSAGCLEPSRRLEREQRETTEDADQGDQPADTVRTVLLCLPDRVQRFFLSHRPPALSRPRDLARAASMPGRACRGKPVQREAVSPAGFRQGCQAHQACLRRRFPLSPLASGHLRAGVLDRSCASPGGGRDVRPWTLEPGQAPRFGPPDHGAPNRPVQ